MGLFLKLRSLLGRRAKTPEQIVKDAEAAQRQRDFELSKARYRN
jgi:hypothetical protein